MRQDTRNTFGTSQQFGVGKQRSKDSPRNHPCHAVLLGGTTDNGLRSFEESVVWSRSRAPGRDSPKYGSQAPPRAAGFSPAAVSNALLALHVRESAGDN